MLKIKGIILKQKLQEAGIKIEDAAKELGIARQTLSNYFKKERLGEDIIVDVKEKLHIDLRAGEKIEPTVPEKELIKAKDEVIEELRRRIEDKEKIINLLESKDQK